MDRFSWLAMVNNYEQKKARREGGGLVWALKLRFLYGRISYQAAAIDVTLRES